MAVEVYSAVAPPPAACGYPPPIPTFTVKMLAVVKVAVKDAPLPPVPELPPPAPPPPVMAMLNVHAKPPPQYEVPLVSAPENPVASATGGSGEGVADGEMHDAASAVEPAGHAAGHPHAMGATAFAGQ
jgi:hypothetical protein